MIAPPVPEVRRVLVWSELYPPYIGGIEIVVESLLRALAPRGYDFLVVTSHDTLDLPDEEEQGGVRIVRLPLRAAFTARSPAAMHDVFAAARRVAGAFQPRLYHLQGLWTSALALLRVHHVHPAPLVVTEQGQVLAGTPAGPDTVRQELLARAAWVTAVAPAVLAQLRALDPSITPRSSCIRNALPASPRPPVPVPPGPPTLLCLGRLVPQKGFDIALRAFAAVRIAHPDARLVVGGDGPERGALGALAVELGVSGACEFRGWIPPERVLDLLDEATLVLMPSRFEGLPLVAAQAAMRGRAVVAAAVGGLPDIVVDGRTGLLVAPEDARGLADAVLHLLDDPGQRRALGEAARLHAAAEFSFEREVDAYDALYRRLTGVPRVSGSATL